MINIEISLGLVCVIFDPLKKTRMEYHIVFTAAAQIGFHLKNR